VTALQVTEDLHVIGFVSKILQIDFLLTLFVESLRACWPFHYFIQQSLFRPSAFVVISDGFWPKLHSLDAWFDSLVASVDNHRNVKRQIIRVRTPAVPNNGCAVIPW